MEDAAPYVPEKPDKLKVEVGKFYRTRTGDRAYVYCAYEGFFDFLFVIDGVLDYHTCQENGEYLLKCEHKFDLIAPWEE